MKTLKVSEFFYSIQGEGKTSGYPAIFLRLGGCNLLCGGSGTVEDKKLHGLAQWRCDTIEVWKKSKAYEPNELVKAMDQSFGFLNLLYKGVRIIITGGEPLLQMAGIEAFLKYLEDEFVILPGLEIETNCTIIPTDFICRRVDQFNVSPKLESSGADMVLAARPKVLEWFSRQSKTTFKFVVCSEGDILSVNEISSIYDIPPQKVWLMPSASSRKELLVNNKMVADGCKQFQFNFTSRLQLEIWNKTVGV